MIALAVAVAVTVAIVNPKDGFGVGVSGAGTSVNNTASDSVHAWVDNGSTVTARGTGTGDNCGSQHRRVVGRRHLDAGLLGGRRSRRRRPSRSACRSSPPRCPRRSPQRQQDRRCQRRPATSPSPPPGRPTRTSTTSSSRSPSVIGGAGAGATDHVDGLRQRPLLTVLSGVHRQRRGRGRSCRRPPPRGRPLRHQGGSGGVLAITVLFSTAALTAQTSAVGAELHASPPAASR